MITSSSLRPFLLLLPPILTILGSSCATKETVPSGRRPSRIVKMQKHGSELEETKLNFPTINDYRISIEAVNPRRMFYAGENVNFVFRIMNTGKKPLEIPEWRLNEAENLKIYYVPDSPEIKTVNDNKWQSETPEWNNKRSTLVLNPGNAVLITKQLRFIKDLDPNTLGPNGRKYLVYAGLNLTSITGRSPVIRLTVR